MNQRYYRWNDRQESLSSRPVSDFPAVFRTGADTDDKIANIIRDEKGRLDRYFLRHLILGPKNSKDFFRKVGIVAAQEVLKAVAHERSNPIPYEVDRVFSFSGRRNESVLAVVPLREVAENLDEDVQTMASLSRLRLDFRHRQLPLGSFSTAKESQQAEHSLENLLQTSNGLLAVFSPPIIEDTSMMRS